jgi:hypothetical protein
MASSAALALEISLLGKGGLEQLPTASVPVHQLLSRLEAGEVFDLSVHSVDQRIQYPIMHIDWHKDAGFVVMVFENRESDGFYPITAAKTGKPHVQIELGGQALERWPRELFVPRETAAAVFETFIRTGRQDSSVPWVANDAFAREVLWETEAQRRAWERKQRGHKKTSHSRAG